MVCALMVMIAIRNGKIDFLVVYNQHPMLLSDLSYFEAAFKATATGSSVRFVIPEFKNNNKGSTANLSFRQAGRSSAD